MDASARRRLSPRSDQIAQCRVGSYSDEHVRALAWAIGAPPIIRPEPDLPPLHQLKLPLVESAEFAEHLAAAREWLETLDEEPAPLRAFLGKNHLGGRIGIYFEALLEFWLLEKSGYELLAHNLQVFTSQAKTKTLGAFDFIVRSKRGAVEHWEVTVKFYLQLGNGSLRSAWIGPNKRDKLVEKMAHMATHQLPLSSTTAGRAALARIGIPDAVVSRAWFKGFLFGAWRSPAQAPPCAAPGEPQGLWLEARHFGEYSGEYAAAPACRWLFRPRPDWLSPARGFGDDFGMRREAAAARAAAVELPELWSRLERDALSDGESWVEVSRLFVMPNGWFDKPVKDVYS